MKNNLDIRGCFAVFATAISGFLVAGLYSALNIPELNRQIAHMTPDEAEWVRTPVIMEICCIFYSTIYFAGQFLAIRIGDSVSADNLKTASKSHMRILHIMSGAFIVVRQSFFRGIGEPFSWNNLVSLAVGLAILILASFRSQMPAWSTILQQSNDR